MSVILCIDTAVVGASVCLAKNAEAIGLMQNPAPLESAAWIHAAIQQLLQEQGMAVSQLEAVAVSAGPGSYTGLRVGLATAKGLCYALNIPLITINTLQLMAMAALQEPTDLLCPMIDARRMEVFTGLFTKEGGEVMPAQALILQADSFFEVLQRSTVTFFGNGSGKFLPVLQHRNAVFKQITTDARHATTLAQRAFEANAFADLAYSEPFYGKEFFSPAAN